MIRLALRVSRADAELVLAELLELAPAGVEEVDLPVCEGREAQVEYAIYGSPGELPDLPELSALAGGVEVKVASSDVPDDWVERWKLFHRSVLVDSPGGSIPSLHVRPPWEPPANIAGPSKVQEIVIDPGQAFGTGAHATTRLCLELLLALAAADTTRGAIVDVGAGSGVLAITAAKLGYAPVLALDNDRLSVEAIATNAAANAIAGNLARAHTVAAANTNTNAAVGGDPVQGRLFDLRSQHLPEGHPVVLANLLRPLLLDLVHAFPRPPVHLIASGLLREEADGIAAVYADRLGLRERERRERGEWAALWLTRR